MNNLYVHVLLPYFDHQTHDMSAYAETCERIVSFHLKEKSNYNRVSFILNHAWELTQTDQLMELHKLFTQHLNPLDIDFYVVYSVSLDDSDELPANIIKYNFFQNKTVHASVASNQPLAHSWNNEKFRGLLLTGKTNKLQRIHPIKKLLDHNMLNTDVMEWSFHYSKVYLSNIAELLNVSNSEAEIFATTANRNPDGIDTTDYAESFDYDGIPYDHSMYENTSWSLISETTTHSHTTWITEKTYRPILNKHPFILFAQPHTENFLRSNDFRTFNYCFPIEYDTIEDELERFDAVMENVFYLKKNWDSLDFERINADVEYNYTTLTNRTSKEETNLINRISFNDGDNVCDLNNPSVTVRSLSEMIKNKQHILFYKWF